MRNARSAGMPGNGIVPRLPAGTDRGLKGSGTALETDESSRGRTVIIHLFPALLSWWFPALDYHLLPDRSRN